MSNLGFAPSWSLKTRWFFFASPNKKALDKLQGFSGKLINIMHLIRFF